jgi:hypothetical protein
MRGEFSINPVSMFSLKMVTFCKSTNCPSSQDLLAFVDSKIPAKEREKVETHLGLCEFCAAEIEFYEHYPQAEEPVAKVEIPIPLYELAEALLGNKHKDFFTLNKLLCEKASVKI